MRKVRIAIASTDWSRSIFDNTGAPVSGGAGWVRLQQLRPLLSNAEVVTGTLIHNPKTGFGIADFYGRMHQNFDILILQRLMFRDLVNTIQQELQRPGRPIIINDVDDWYWGLDPANAAYELTRPEKNPTENINHYKTILQLSDVITVSTPFLRDQMQTWLKHKNVVLIENRLTISDFTVRRLNVRKPIIGWVGSTSHRSRDLEELQGFFPSSNRFHHSGHIPGAPLFATALGIDRGRVTTSPLVPPRDFAKNSFCFDIGLAPLSDIPFNHAKSWIKAIEYAASGVPFVASPAPEYIRLHETYGIGRIAHSKEEWLGHVDELKNTALRNKEASQNRDLVKDLDVKYMAQDWDALIKDIT